MSKIYNLFSIKEASAVGHSVDSANELLPLVRKYTEEAIERTDALSFRLQYLAEGSNEFNIMCRQYDEVVLKWAERIHRVGGLAKGLWLVDFDTGRGYLCWAFPEERIQHFHSYEGSYKTRTRLPGEASPLAQNP